VCWQLIDEIEMGSSGYAEPGSIPRRGHFADLEYLFTVKITNLGENVRNAIVPLPLLGSVGRQTDEAYVRLDFRIVDATTGEIVFAVYRKSNITDSKGTVVFTEERPVGTLTGTEVQIDRSIAKIASDGDLEEGYVVRR
jgi:hypothetical protein